MFPQQILARAHEVVGDLAARKLHIVTAESCTGGLVAGALTSIPGSSAVVDGGWVTYSNAAKQSMIGVLAATLESHGAVSEQTAREMAQGALDASNADISIAVTGIAGPGGGTPEKPVGLVYIACATQQSVTCERQLFEDLGREAIRIATVQTALTIVRDRLRAQP